MILPMLALLIFGLAVIGCSDSDEATITQPPVIDTAPPAVPTGLSAAFSNDVVKLSWHANTTDVDFLGYRVYRLAYGQTWLLTGEPVAEARFIDLTPVPGYVIYAVTSVDELGNESAWIQLLFNYPEDDRDYHRP